MINLKFTHGNNMTKYDNFCATFEFNTYMELPGCVQEMALECLPLRD